MSELFESYEKEYCDLSGSINCDLNELQSASMAESPQLRDQKIRKIETDFASLTEALRNMEIELRSLPGVQRVKLSTRMQNYQRDMTNLKKEYEKAKTVSARKALFSGRGSGGVSPSSTEYGRQTAETTDQMAKQNDMLTEGIKLTTEMEFIGNDTMKKLVKDGEKMNGILDTVRDTSMETSRARRFLTQIRRRAVLNKLIIIAVILVLLIIIVVIVYNKWIKNITSSSSSNKPSTTPTVVNPSPSPSPTNATAAIRNLAYALAQHQRPPGVADWGVSQKAGTFGQDSAKRTLSSTAAAAASSGNPSVVVSLAGRLLRGAHSEVRKRNGKFQPT